MANLSIGPVMANPHPPTEMQRAEREFRAMAFHVAYLRTYARIHDKAERFALAIQLNAQPIRDDRRGMILNWYRKQKLKRLKRDVAR